MVANRFLLPRLGTMVFLQEFVYGTWLVSMGLILTNYGLSSVIGLSYAVGGIAAIISPVFAGLITDRLFQSQNVLAILNLIGGLILWFIPAQIIQGNEIGVLTLMFLYNLVFIPSYSLRNNVSLRNVVNKKRDFPLVTIFGTVGFMAAGLVIGVLGLSGNPVGYQVGAGISIFAGLYNLTLPKTPPLAKGKPFTVRDWLCLDAYGLLKDKDFRIFIICTFLLFIPFIAYSSFASVLLGDLGVQQVSSVMTLGQVSEVIMLLLLPLIFRKLGYKVVLTIGILAWALRSALFAFGAPDEMVILMYAAIALHGFCWNFFFVTGFMYVDDKAGPHVKSQAQGLLMMFSQGFGVVFGSLITGYLYNNLITEQGTNALAQWPYFWFAIAGFTMIVGIIFLLSFNKKQQFPAKISTYDEGAA
ncbi:MFS transporter [Shouchella clausii]|uniref:MFS transporter n=1 Tax=Shouchella clausii TaxID=79880 RepID=UPI002896B125|nr:MFS transporter [Shouchella clausii]